MLRPTTSRQHWRPLLVFAGIAVLLTTWQHQAASRDATSLPEWVCRAVSYPVLVAFTAVHAFVHDVGISVVNAPSLQAENRRLREDRDRLQFDKTLLTEHFLENKRIKEKLGFEEEQEVEDIPAQVIIRAPGNTRITIGAARGREVHVGDIVREAGGLVGRVTEVHGTSAQVILLVDPEHAFSGVAQRSRDEGMVYPVSTLAGVPQRLRLEKLRRDADLQEGDVILTSGLDGVYPRGIPIGTVESVQRSRASIETVTAVIKPFVDFDHLDCVWVVSRP